jgi:hypothetical protein
VVLRTVRKHVEHVPSKCEVQCEYSRTGAKDAKHECRKETEYKRIDYSFKGAFRRGVTVKHIAVDENCTVKRALRFLDERSYVAFEIYDKQEKFLGTLPQNVLAEKFAEVDLYQPLSTLLQ